LDFRFCLRVYTNTRQSERYAQNQHLSHSIILQLGVNLAIYSAAVPLTNGQVVMACMPFERLPRLYALYACAPYPSSLLSLHSSSFFIRTWGIRALAVGPQSPRFPPPFSIRAAKYIAFPAIRSLFISVGSPQAHQ
jgi:hypothetical protein